MTARIIYNNTAIDLKDIPSDSRLAILTGSFDPVHIGHIEIANQALKRNYGLIGVDLVLFFLHSYSEEKILSPYQARFEILNGFLSDYPDLGNLVIDDSDLIEYRRYYYPSSSPSWVKVLFKFLTWYHPIVYARIIGSDRIEQARTEKLDIPHFVSPRKNERIVVPRQFYLLPKPKFHLSSELFRQGKIPFDEQYSQFFSVIRKIYPEAIIANKP